MNQALADTVSINAPLIRWQGERGTYHLIRITGGAAEHIAMHERIRRLEFGARRGFGSVKVKAQIGESQWNSSVFPQSRSDYWVLLISKKIMRAEDLAEGDDIRVQLELL